MAGDVRGGCAVGTISRASRAAVVAEIIRGKSPEGIGRSEQRAEILSAGPPRAAVPTNLLDYYGLHQVAWMVDVNPFVDGNVVGEELQRDHLFDWQQQFWRFGHIENMIGDP